MFNRPNMSYAHVFDSYHQFICEIIPYDLMKETNHVYEKNDNHIMYLRGFQCYDVNIKLPTFENNNESKFPSDAQKNNLNIFLQS